MTLTLDAEAAPSAAEMSVLALCSRLNELLHCRGWSPVSTDTARLLERIEHIRLGGLPVLLDWSRIDPSWYWEHSLVGREADESCAIAPTYVKAHVAKGTVEVAYAFPAGVEVDTWCDDHRPVEMSLPFTSVGIDALVQLVSAIEAYAVDQRLVTVCVASGRGCGTFDRFEP
ncbi:hypothetical protein ACFXD5_15665 [Streptomyces sp. NPDC059385]|uniref:hypothetical protein n=1 Tax=Streptomyces sp. NPDC059385 TaxID=3346817 RepID=UPI00367B88BD